MFYFWDNSLFIDDVFLFVCFGLLRFPNIFHWKLLDILLPLSSLERSSYHFVTLNLNLCLNTERAYKKKAPSSTLLASILKSCVRVTVMKEKSSANFAF